GVGAPRRGGACRSRRPGCASWGSSLASEREGEAELVEAVLLVGAPEDAEVGLGRERRLGGVLDVDVGAAAGAVVELDQQAAAGVGDRVALEAVEPVEVLGRERPHEPGHAALAVAHHRRHAAAPRRALAREAEAVAVQDGGRDQARARTPAAHLLLTAYF